MALGALVAALGSVSAAVPSETGAAATESGIRVSGDPAVFDLLNAWRRDDGKIEITTSRTLEGLTSTSIYLVTCAPLALGTIATGDNVRNDAPVLERLPLGSAKAWLAAMACGGLK